MAKSARGRLSIEIRSVDEDSVPAKQRQARADDAMLSLARLIGRQMAREAF